MEGRAIVGKGMQKSIFPIEAFASHMGAESHSPKIWGKDQEADLAFKAQTTPRGNSSYEHPDHNYEKSETPGLHQWGMAIDLNQCTGCSACVVACQSENNIPIVGKDQVLTRSRDALDQVGSDISVQQQEMGQNYRPMFKFHFKVLPACIVKPHHVKQFVPLMQLFMMKKVLNAMAYNRCVGTRYCANNCPYKVRRFNFFDWNKR